ncbi:ABC transporter ATP-binding protein [Clostridium perfringens]|uniref:ABC transporter ATP-binding protein n=1 Tax=Clostridium perfringens TaxID=1502 RepID=UPI0024BCACEC|nr:energy-coupling factor ABC transporter ATP-binding protein [Clostridium perfringens]MDZ4997399.1 ATP-binding cassette domain-containing protein [Clostridium perfringens]
MIQLENVSFSYTGRKNNSVKNVNLNINEGECILICGRSGCGKTTVIRHINKLIPWLHSGDSEGRVYIENENIVDIPMYKISEKVGSVFQNPRSQFFNVDTDSEIAFGLENLSYPQETIVERVEQTYEEMNIKKLRNRSIFELSGGEKQKIAFASAYAMMPEIYVLDEPSSNLDIYAIDELKENIEQLKSQGKTIVIAEHRLYYLKDVADKIVYMEEGKIKKIFTPDEMIKLKNEERENMGLRILNYEDVEKNENNINKCENSLELKDLCVGYKNKDIINNISFIAHGGEIISIIGHNGAGKSTFLRTLCGLLKKKRGTIKYNGTEIKSKKQLELSYMVMQDVNYQLFAESLEKECTLGLNNIEIDKVWNVLKELNLYEYREMHPATLSGGQKQRLAVAAGIVSGKEILIFDEPTSGLDFDSMKKVSDLMVKLSKMGKIIFVVTHDYEFISLCSTRIIHLDDGQMIEDYELNKETINRLKEFFIK